MSHGGVLFLMTGLFLGLGYMGVPVAFALMAGVLVAASLTPISSGPWSYPKLRCSRVRTRTVVNPPTTPLRTPVTRIAAANVK